MSTPNNPAPARLEVTVAEDALSAFLRREPSDNDAPDTLEHALALLAEAHVTFGIDPTSVEAALQQPGQRVCVARGRPPVHGTDATVEYAPSLLAVGGRPHVADSGTVDLAELGLVHNVDAGAILATLTPPVDGQPGIDVHGRAMRARPGRRARVRAGKGACASQDGSHILAALAGHATRVGDAIEVSPIYYVRGDVGPATGNIDFVGSVSITGDLQPGFHIRAGGDVEIQGTVRAGAIDAAGNVSVRYGIHGHEGHGRVTAGGSVHARFIEFADVRAGGAVFATDGIVRATVEAGEQVEVVGRHGSVVGGRIVAASGLCARDLGSTHAVATQIVVGAAPELLNEAQRLQARQPHLVDELQRAQQLLAVAQDYDRQQRLSESGRHELVRLHDGYRALLDERSELLARQAELIERLRASRQAAVEARGTCYAGVRVVIGTATHVVRQDWQGVRFQRNAQTHEVEMIGLAEAAP